MGVVFRRLGDVERKRRPRVVKVLIATIYPLSLPLLSPSE